MMKLSDATRLSVLVKAYQKRLRQVESVQRRTARLLDAIDDAELTEDVRVFLEATFDDSSDAIVAGLAAMRRIGGDTAVDNTKEPTTNGHESNRRHRD